MNQSQPALFISHGSPMTALQPGRTGQQLACLAATMPRPQAVIVATAHWLTQSPLVGAAEHPATIHDFSGFPEPLYQIDYPARGAPALAAEVTALLQSAALSAQADPHRGLDHGVWVPLRMLYPAADIPVIPLAIQPLRDPLYHFKLGRALAPLRERGILIIGSGSITHNLHDLRHGYSAENEAPYVRPFVDWMEQHLAAGAIESLLDYRRQAPFAARAHPTDEHLLPLFVALGAAGEVFEAQRLDAGVDLGILAMDIYAFNG